LQPIVPDGILIDQFELPSTYFKHIQDQPNQIEKISISKLKEKVII